MRTGGVSGKRLEDHPRCLTPELGPKKVHPEYLRDAFLAWYRIRDVALALREEQTAAGADLRTRLEWACIIDTIDGRLADLRRELSVIARRGGQGVAAVTP